MNTNKNTQDIIYQRTRDRQGNPKGVLVAKKLKNGTVGISYSLTNTKAGDKFSLKEGLAIATARAVHGCPETIPQSIQNDYSDFTNRAKRYFFKNKAVKLVPVKN